ncbi:MAG: acyl-CoA dehydrogenase family protein [Steroidobacteraceae bacterium]|jgi:alkylation response protein AidB-like acyl-CoA dehydrogenase|nr:acyl-CoA dehydrogenase family protein [Steroidobacteraceae bacterium]
MATAPADARPSTDEELQILDAIDAWVEKEVRPIARKFDQADEYPHDLVEQMKELGLFGATISPEYGGLGLSASTYARIVTRIASVWMAPTGIFNSHLIMAQAVERAGTPAQKAKWLPKFATGELRGGIGLTEPNAGTDLQGIRTLAVRDGAHFRINGTKTWITNGVYGTCFAVLTKTNPNAEPRYKGMSMFLCEKGAGFTVGKKLKKLGYRSIDSAELVFDDHRVPADQLIGGEEGHGFHHAVGGLELGRINVAARGVGLAQGALQEALRYAQQRQTFGKPIAQHQAIQLKLADMATRTEAARLLVEQAARKYDTGERCDLEAGMAKLFASEAAVANSLDGMRIFGGYSYSTDFDIERYFRDSPLMCIGEGTNEMQRIIIAKQLVARNPA